MKKLLVLSGVLFTGVIAFARFGGGIDEKLLQVFKTSFPAAQEVKWHESNGLYIANFKEDGIRVRATYKKDAVLAQLIRSYQQDRLPYFIQFRVHEQFPRKKIFGVIEVVTKLADQSVIEYYIKLEDARNWTTIRIDGDGEITVVEKFKKSI